MREGERDRGRQGERERGGGAREFFFFLVLTKKNPSYPKNDLSQHPHRRTGSREGDRGASAQVVSAFKSTLRRLLSVSLHSIPS